MSLRYWARNFIPEKFVYDMTGLGCTQLNKFIYRQICKPYGWLGDIYFNLIWLNFGHTRRKWHSVSISRLHIEHILSLKGMLLYRPSLHSSFNKPPIYIDITVLNILFFTQNKKSSQPKFALSILYVHNLSMSFMSEFWV